MRRLGWATVIVGVLWSGRARAAAYDFPAGSWIIPMDVCYQTSQPFNGSGFSGTTPASTVFAGSCPDPTPPARDGILKAYGLVYRLLQNNVPVYYVLDTNKKSVDDVDMTITSPTGTPVGRVNHSGATSTFGTVTEFMSGAHQSIAYRGAPFVIAAADVPTALSLLKTNPSFTGIDPRTRRMWFEDVTIHQAKVNILQAPVRAILLQTPPKVALLDIGGAAIGVLQGYLKDAGLFTSTAAAVYPTIGDVFTQLTKVSDFTTGNALGAGGFAILWAPHWDGTNVTASQRDQVIQKITAFVDAGHPFVGQCAAVATLEGAVSMRGGNEPASSYGHLVTTANGNTIGLKTNQLNQPRFPVGADAIVVNPAANVQAWIDPLTQTGDYPLAIDVASATFDFTPAAGVTYKPFVASYVQSRLGHLQIETVAHKDGDANKGLVIYLGGHSYGSQGSSCGGSCVTFNQYNTLGLERLVLNSLVFLGQMPQTAEQTRSAPIVYSDGKTYLGSYVQESAPSTSYPPWTGHFRQYPAGALAGTHVTGFGAIPSDWDAADHVKVQASTDARTIFTALPAGGRLTQADFTTADLAALQAVVPTLTATQVTGIRKGALGGVDHSIPAIIGPSTIAGSPTRPTVAYFGALDGMLHAVLVSGSVAGKNAGDELWAFIPPSQLAKTVGQSGGVDGSPSVGDAFVDVGGGARAWRTLLAVPDGSYAGGTLDVLDVTDPTAPRFLWEASDTFAAGGRTYVLGRAQGAAMSPLINAAGGVQFAYFLATDNANGTWGNGFNLYALDAGTGSVIWRYDHTYVADTMHNDVPGAVAVIDDAGDGGPVSKLYFGDLEGKVWSLQAGTGGGATAIYDAAAADGHAGSIDYPIENGIALYRDPTTTHLMALGVTSGADWVPSTTLSKVFKVDLQKGAATTVATLATGERVYALPTVAGNSVYVITSFGQLQSALGNSFTATGNVVRIGLGATPSVTTLATVTQGASEVAVDGNGNVIAASATGLTMNANAGADKSQATLALQNAAQRPLLVRAWLDLHE